MEAFLLPNNSKWHIKGLEEEVSILSKITPYLLYSEKLLESCGNWQNQAPSSLPEGGGYGLPGNIELTQFDLG